MDFRAFKKLDQAWYALKQGLQNLWYWLPFIWSDRDWDWIWLAKIMEAKLRKMHKNTRNWNVEGADKAAREMLVCAELLRRLRCGYYGESLPLGQDWEIAKYRWNWHKHVEAIDKQDIELLFTLLRKHMRSWWD